MTLPSNSSKPRLIAVTEHHFVEAGGHAYSPMTFDYDHWRVFLEVFSEVVLVSRGRRADAPPPGWIRATGEGVRFHRVREYRGPLQFALRMPGVLRDCWRGVGQPGCILLHMGNMSNFCLPYLLMKGRPWGFEVLGDAGLAVRLFPDTRRFGLGGLFGRIVERICRFQARHAACVNYVSRTLRELYPSGNGKEWYASDVRLPAEHFRPPRPQASFEHSPKQVALSCRLEPEKGHAVFLKAVQLLAERGISDFRVKIAGSGTQMESLKQLIAQYNLADRVQLLGLVQPGQPLQTLLDESDLYILPSFQEGMPRALLEAMARSLPAISTIVGGTVDLLPQECLVPQGDAQALADRMAAALCSPAKLAEMSACSYAKACEFRQDLLKKKRMEFWNCLVQASKNGE